MTRAKVAIITRTKDRPIMLERAISSVCSQTFQDWVMVIVNDGGDRTEVNRLITRYEKVLKGRVKVIHHEKSLGMEAASNRGIIASDSDYILIHDDDDSLDRFFLEKTVSILDSSIGTHFGGVATKVTRVIEEIEGDKIIIKNQDSWQKDLNSITLADMAISNKLVPISLLYKRKVHDVVGYYNESLPVLGDWEFYLRFLAKFDIFLLNEELANYHHRLTLKEGIYSNTIIGGVQLHYQYDAFIRNQLMRKDLREGKIGLGFLVNVARINQIQFEGIRRQFETLHEQLDKKHLELDRLLNENKKLHDPQFYRIIKLLVGLDNILKNKKVVLFGTGEAGKLVYHIMEKFSIPLEYCVDNDRSKWGLKFNNIEIKSPETLLKENMSDIFVLVSSSFTKEISQQLEDMGFVEGENYYSLF